ncbi:MAG: S9 family peptidase, partial [Tepidiformaceae bacterium]
MSRPYEHLTLADVARQPRPGTVVPARLGFTPDGRGVTYLFSEGGNLVRSLWRFDIATGERRVLAGPPPASTSEGQLSREEELRRERARLRELGVTDYQFARDADPAVLLVPGGGRLYVSIAGAPASELEGGEGAIDPRLSSDGTQVAFVREGEVYVLPVTGGEPTRLTFGAEDGLTNGLAEFIAQEELDRDHGFWWSDDGRLIAYIKADCRHIPAYPIVHQGTVAVDIEYHRYPFAGQPNALLELAVVDVATGQTTLMDLGSDRDIYIGRVDWRPDGVLTAQILSRDQKHLRLLAFDIASGAARVLIEELGDPWVNLSSDVRFLESGEMLWSSEKTGFRHLYVHDRDGHELRQLTRGDWVVTGVNGVDEARRLVYFTATKASVLQRQLYVVSLEGGDVGQVTFGDGIHGAVLPKGCDVFLDVYSSVHSGARIVLRDLDGAERAVLFEQPAATAEAFGLRPPDFVSLPASDGTLLHGAIYRPPVLEAGKRYPVIISVYGGPHVQRVANDWSLTMDLRAQYLAEHGFVVFKLDNRGGFNRGLAFEAALADRMGTVEVDDQLAGVRYLASLPYA